MAVAVAKQETNSAEITPVGKFNGMFSSIGFAAGLQPQRGKQAGHTRAEESESASRSCGNFLSIKALKHAEKTEKKNQTESNQFCMAQSPQWHSALQWVLKKQSIGGSVAFTSNADKWFLHSCLPYLISSFPCRRRPAIEKPCGLSHPKTCPLTHVYSPCGFCGWVSYWQSSPCPRFRSPPRLRMAASLYSFP